MIKRFHGKAKLALICFGFALLSVLVVSVIFDSNLSKLPQKLFPRPALSPEMLEDYWKNPRPLPKAIRSVTIRMNNGEYFGVSILPSVLWMVGDEATDTYSGIQRSFELYIDGVYHDTMVGMEATAMVMGKGGSIGGTIYADLKLTNLYIGLHSAEIQFSDLHGRVYFYAWVFEVIS